MTVLLRGAPEAIAKAFAAAGVVASEVRDESAGLTRAHVTLPASTRGDAREALVAALVQAGVGVRRVVEDEGELEQIFLGLTKESAQ